MIKIECSGSFTNTFNFFNRMNKFTGKALLEKYGQMCVESLKRNTPKDSGMTASSWDYKVYIGERKSSIVFTNSAKADNVPLVILLQYGHATKNGGYVEGVDFINPALNQTFRSMAEELWREVTKQ